MSKCVKRAVVVHLTRSINYQQQQAERLFRCVELVVVGLVVACSVIIIVVGVHLSTLERALPSG